MQWGHAVKELLAGKDIKLPAWYGFWRYDKEKDAIMMHCKGGEILDLRETERSYYTFIQNMGSDKWVVATELNCPLLGGHAYLDFETALTYLDRGIQIDNKELGISLIKTEIGDFVDSYGEVRGRACEAKCIMFTKAEFYSKKWELV